MRDHAMLGSHAALAHVPESQQGLERLDRVEALVRAERVDVLLHLQHGRHEGGQHAARPERRGEVIEQRHGSARSTTMRSTPRSTIPA